MASLQGNLRAFGMADIFQLIAQQRQTGVLEFTHEDRAIQISFEDGRVVKACPPGPHEHFSLGQMLLRCGLITQDKHVELESEVKRTCQSLVRLLLDQSLATAEEIREVEDLLTRETLFDLLRWVDGEFDFRSCSIHHDRDPMELIPTDHILMDGLRMVDEWHQFIGQVPNDSVVFQKVFDSDAVADTFSYEDERQLEQIQKLFRRVDGRISTRRIIDLTRVGTFEGTRILSELRKAGAIELVEQEEGRGRSGKLNWKEFRFHQTPVQIAISIAVPVTLLFALMIYALGGGEDVHVEAFTVHRTPLKETRIFLETQRLRNLAEAYRYSAPYKDPGAGANRWPEKMEALVDEKLIEPHELTGMDGKNYYFSLRRGEGILILAPEY